MEAGKDLKNKVRSTGVKASHSLVWEQKRLLQKAVEKAEKQIKYQNSAREFQARTFLNNERAKSRQTPMQLFHLKTGGVVTLSGNGGYEVI